MKISSTTLNSLPRSIKKSFRGRYVALAQVAAVRICRFCMNWLGGFTIKSDVTFDNDTLYLFAANHQSIWDPFAIFGSMPLSQNFKVAPTKFMTAKGIYYSPLRPFVASIGCYPTRIKDTDIIDYSTGLMAKGYSLFIFPEGRRSLPSESNPKYGVCKLIEKTREFSPTIILIHIDWKMLGRIRRHATISITRAKPDIDLTDPQAIMKEIYSL